jgi:hypothetical protein
MLRGGIGDKWYATIGVEITNPTNKLDKKVFYLLVCSDSAAKNPPRKMPKPDPKYTLIDDEVHMKNIKKIATERVLDIKATNWNDFLEKMENSFLVAQ